MVWRPRLGLVTLERGETLGIEGFQVRMIEGEIQPGDWYVGERNMGPKLLTARKLVEEENLVGGFIVPNELAYPYDLNECVRVEVLGL